jgi:hypothetical protein
MTVAYWIVAALLALFYLYSGGLKVLRSPDQLRPMMGWIDTVPLRLVRTIGGGCPAFRGISVAAQG